MKIVYKKILPEYFSEVIDGNKTFELRKDEDNFQVGDIIVLQEYNIDRREYTGRKIKVIVTYVLRNVPQYGLNNGYCVFSIKPINEDVYNEV